MAEPPGAGASLGIESVHWHATGHSSVTVVVTGWWTRRPRWHGRPVLVIEENGRRHRLPAIPEPPSRTGTSPRTWRMTFSLPAWLVEYLNQSAWLQLGSVIVALPEVIEPEAAVVAWGEGSAELQADAVASAEPSLGDELPEPETGSAPAADAEPLEQPEPAPYHEADTHRGAMRWLRRRGPGPPAEPEPAIAEPEPEPELELVPAPEPEATEPEPEAEAEVEVEVVREPEPESEPEGPREPPVEQVLAAAAADLGQRIRRLERERRTAEQRAHAEEARRIELEDQQVELTRKANRWRTSAIELAAAEHRIRELETELGEVTRRLEDAEHAAGTAEAERDRTLRDLDYIRRSPWRGRLPDELVVARRPRPARTTGDSEPVAGNGHSAERARAQLRREQEAVATSESNRWRDRALGLERQLRDHAHRAERLYEVIDDLRAVLDLIRGVPSEAPESQRPLVEPLRLDAALERLRETIPPQSEHEPNPGFVRALESARGAETTTTVVAQGEPTAAEPAEAHPEPEPLPERQLPAALPPARARWLLRVLRKLAKEDPVAAGRLVVQLLPAQRIVYNEPVAYDIALADARDVQLTCRDGETRIAYDQRHREAAEINFRLTGELEALGRLVAARPFRRRFGRRMPELEGDRKAVAALRALVRAPVGLLALSDAGVRLDPWLTFTLLSLMIRPAWTKGERFTVAHSDPEESLSLCLRIADGARPSVEPTPASDEVDTTIVCERYGLLPVIVGQDSPGASILGDQEPLAKLRQWSHRAERD